MAMQPALRRFPNLTYWIVFVLILLFMIGPLILANIAETVADSHGCALHEGFANACMVDGSDWGDTLYAWFVAGWLVFVTFPLGIVALVAWGFVRSFHRRNWIKRHAATLG